MHTHHRPFFISNTRETIDLHSLVAGFNLSELWWWLEIHDIRSEIINCGGTGREKRQGNTRAREKGTFLPCLQGTICTDDFYRNAEVQCCNYHMKEAHLSYRRNFCSCERKPEKNLGLYGIRILDLCDTCAARYQLN